VEQETGEEGKSRRSVKRRRKGKNTRKKNGKK
jgi:hypothetical protein